MQSNIGAYLFSVAGVLYVIYNPDNYSKMICSASAKEPITFIRMDDFAEACTLIAAFARTDIHGTMHGTMNTYPQNKIPLISTFRRMCGCGLKDAKDIIEAAYALACTDKKMFDRIVDDNYQDNKSYYENRPSLSSDELVQKLSDVDVGPRP